MAATTTQSSIADNSFSFVKSLAESPSLESIPAAFTLASDTRGSHTDSIPIIDFSLLSSSDPERRSKVLHNLAKACEEWGFFVLVNHGIPESRMKEIIDTSLEFLNLPEEEKRRYEAKSAADPIKSGTGNVYDANAQRILLWRDFIKCYVHPKFYCPDKPQSLRDIVSEYSERTRSISKTLIYAIGENLGLEQAFMDQALGLDECFQLFAANYYPPCPQPDQAMGIPSHTDHGLLTFLVDNGVAGLQMEHDGEWFHSPQNSFIVLVADHLQIFTNGRYKGAKHRVVLNTKVARLSVAIANGPAPDACVTPAPKLVEKDGRPLYGPMKFMEYVEMMNKKPRVGNFTNLDCLKIQYE